MEQQSGTDTKSYSTFEDKKSHGKLQSSPVRAHSIMSTTLRICQYTAQSTVGTCLLETHKTHQYQAVLNYLATYRIRVHLLALLWKGLFTVEQSFFHSVLLSTGKGPNKGLNINTCTPSELVRRGTSSVHVLCTYGTYQYSTFQVLICSKLSCVCTTLLLQVQNLNPPSLVQALKHFFIYFNSSLLQYFKISFGQSVTSKKGFFFKIDGD